MGWVGEVGRSLTARGECFDLLPARDVRAGSQRVSLASHAVASLLAPLFADPHDAARLRALARGLALGVAARSDAEVLQRLARAIEVGQLVLVRAERPRLYTYTPRSLPGQPGPDDDAAAAADPRSHWVALRVVDDDSAEPVPDLDVVVVLPDRSEVRATTDGAGRVELRSAEGGSCDVRSASAGEYFSLCVTFVGMGRAVKRPPAAGPAARALVPRGRKLRDGKRALLDVAEYHVRDGDTWDEIAGRHGTTAEALMRFNFDTTAPAEIQVAMSEHLGCWRRDPDSGELLFTADDDPGVLLVPRPWQRSLATGYEHVLRVRAIRAPARPYIFSV